MNHCCKVVLYCIVLYCIVLYCIVRFHSENPVMFPSLAQFCYKIFFSLEQNLPAVFHGSIHFKASFLAFQVNPIPSRVSEEKKQPHLISVE